MINFVTETTLFRGIHFNDQLTLTSMITNYRVEHRTDGVKNLDCDYEQQSFDAGFDPYQGKIKKSILGCQEIELTIGDNYLEYSSVLGTYRSKIPALAMHVDEEPVRLGIHHRFNITSHRMETYFPRKLDTIRIKKPNFRFKFPVEVTVTAARHQTIGRKHRGKKLRAKKSQLVDCQAKSSRKQKHCVRVEPVPKACKYCDYVNLTFRKISFL